jgi:hypothetical protein
MEKQHVSRVMKETKQAFNNLVMKNIQYLNKLDLYQELKVFSHACTSLLEYCFPSPTVPTCTESIVQTSTEQKQNKSEMYVWTRL